MYSVAFLRMQTRLGKYTDKLIAHLDKIRPGTRRLFHIGQQWQTFTRVIMECLCKKNSSLEHTISIPEEAVNIAMEYLASENYQPRIDPINKPTPKSVRLYFKPKTDPEYIEEQKGRGRWS